MEPNLRAIALENAVKHGRDSDLKTILSTADTFLEWLERKTPIIPQQFVTNYSQTELDVFAKISKHPINILPYIMVQHPCRGTIPLDIHPYVNDTINFMHDNRYGIVLKARQMGGTTWEAIYALWFAMFKPDQTILITSHKLHSAIEILDRIKYMENYLPMFLRSSFRENNKQTLRFENGSTIMVRTATKDCGRGIHIDLHICDEAAVVSFKSFNEMMDVILPMISCHGKLLMVSSAGKSEGLFYQMCEEAPGNGFAKLVIPHDLYPNRDKEWIKQMRERLGPDGFAQHFECVFK